MLYLSWASERSERDLVDIDTAGTLAVGSGGLAEETSLYTSTLPRYCYHTSAGSHCKTWTHSTYAARPRIRANSAGLKWASASRTPQFRTVAGSQLSHYTSHPAIYTRCALSCCLLKYTTRRDLFTINCSAAASVQSQIEQDKNKQSNNNNSSRWPSQLLSCPLQLVTEHSSDLHQMMKY